MFTENLVVFLVTFFTGGVLVWADLSLEMAAVWGVITIFARQKLAFWGTLSHALCGALGLIVFYFGGVHFAKEIGGFFILAAAYLGLSFTIHGLQSDDDEEEPPIIKALSRGGFKVVMLALLPVSIDQYYAILQKTQWMQVKGWSIDLIILNFVLSMVVLYVMLKITSYSLNRGGWTRLGKSTR